MLAIAIGLAMPAPASAGEFLKLTGLNGDQWTPVLSFHFSAVGGMASRASERDGVAAGGEVVIQLAADAASSSLMEAAARGASFAEADLKTGGGEGEYLIYHLKEVIISGFQSGGGAERTQETLTLRYRKAEMERTSGGGYRPGREFDTPELRALQGPSAHH
jgi:hypothetical protein